MKFKSDVDVEAALAVSGGLTLNSTGNAVLNVNGTANSFIEKDTGTDLYIANNVGDKDIIFRVKDDTTNVIALTLDGSEGGNAAFAGTVTAPTFLGDLSGTINTATTGATQTAGDNSTLIATTAYADAAAAAVPIGNYLPLAGGTLTGFLTGTGGYFTSNLTTTGVLTIQAGNPYIQWNNAAGTRLGYIQHSTNLVMNADSGKIVLNTAADNDILINPGGTGNVGIGTTAPSQKLHVSGSARVTGAYYDSNNSAGIAGQALLATAAGAAWTSVGVIGRITSVVAGTGLTGGGTSGAVTLNSSWTATGNDIYNNNSANVGIGTTSPTAKLDVKGDGAEIYLKSADYSVARIIPRGTGTNVDKGLFSLFDTGVENVRIDTEGSSWFNGGNVGIGTTAPSEKLHVFEAGTAMIRVDSGATSPYKAGIEFLRSSVNGGRIYNDGNAVQVKLESDFAYDAANPTRGGFMFKTAPVTSATLVDAVRIDARGYVGIGNAGPSQALHVTGNARVTGAYYDSNNSPGIAGQALLATAAGAAWTSVGVIGRITSVVAGTGLTGGGTSGAVTLNSSWTATGNDIYNNNSANVGINTTSPNEKLQVVGNIQGGGVDQASSEFNTSAIFRGQNDGAAYINLIAKNTANSGLLLGVSASGVIDSYVAGLLYNNATNTLNIHVNNQNAIVIDSSQQVGINVSAPTQRLHVDGSARVTGAFYDSSNDPGTAGQVLSSTATGTNWVAAGGGGSTVYTAAIWEVDSDTFTTDDTTIICDTNRIYNGTTSVSNAGPTTGSLVIDDAGVYEISYSVSIKAPSSSTTRQVPALYLTLKPSGGTEVKIPGSINATYLRLPGVNQGGFTSLSNKIYVEVAAEAEIQLKIVWLNGNTKSTEIYTAASIQNTISIRRIT